MTDFEQVKCQYCKDTYTREMPGKNEVYIRNLCLDCDKAFLERMNSLDDDGYIKPLTMRR